MDGAAAWVAWQGGDMMLIGDAEAVPVWWALRSWAHVRAHAQHPGGARSAGGSAGPAMGVLDALDSGPSLAHPSWLVLSTALEPRSGGLADRSVAGWNAHLRHPWLWSIAPSRWVPAGGGGSLGAISTPSRSTVVLLSRAGGCGL